jgi:hypothetical protein
MSKTKEDITRQLESNHIDDVILAFDNLIGQTSFLLEKSLASLKKNVEWRSFISERIYKIIQKQKTGIESFYNNEEDNDLRFWLSTLAVEFDHNTRYFTTILNYVKEHEDEKEILGLNILVQNSIREVDEIIISKLKKLDFSINTFDRITFYLSHLKRLEIVLPPVVIKKINEYNNGVKSGWQKLNLES